MHLNSLKLNTHQSLRKVQGWGTAWWKRACLHSVFWGKKEGGSDEGKS